MFLRNVWYVVAFGEELAPLAVIARRVVDEPIVLFRTAGGDVVGLEDRCSHRGMPLARGGECTGDSLRCPYHGLEFGRTGACVRIPGQEYVPDTASIRAYPVIERDGLVWLWPGEPAYADPTEIPSYPYHDDPTWTGSSFHVAMDVNWQLINDNVLDLSHLGYVHKLTIGGNPQAHTSAEMTTERSGERVHVRRWILDCEPSPTFRAYRNFTGNIDRWQEIDFRPGVFELFTGASDAGTGAREGRYEGGVHIRHIHGITPETDGRTRYFFAQSRNFQIDDTTLTAKLHELAELTFQEDKVVLEAQQVRRAEGALRPFFNIRSDAGGVYARRIVEELYAREKGERVVVPAL